MQHCYFLGIASWVWYLIHGILTVFITYSTFKYVDYILKKFLTYFFCHGNSTVKKNLVGLNNIKDLYMYMLSHEGQCDISFIARGTISYFVTSEHNDIIPNDKWIS